MPHEPAPEAPAPDLNESLRHMQASVDDLYRRPADHGAEEPAPEPAEPAPTPAEAAREAQLDRLLADDDGYDEPGGDGPEAGEDPDVLSEDEARGLFREEAAELLAPVFERETDREVQERAEQIRDLAERHPQLKREAFAAEVGAAAREYAARFDRPDLAFDPALLEHLTLAASAAEYREREQAQEGAQPAGAHLEQGAGPGVPEEPEPDRIQRQYDKVFRQAEGDGVFT